MHQVYGTGRHEALERGAPRVDALPLVVVPVELGDPIELGRELFVGAALGTAQVSLGVSEDPVLERVGPLAEPGRVLSGVELGPLSVVLQRLKS